MNSPKNFKQSLKVVHDKSASYEQTIAQEIRILKNLLKGTDYKLHLEPFPTDISNVWIWEVKIYKGNTALFTSHGKGHSFNSGLASGLGEMIERIQAGFLFYTPSKRLFLTVDDISEDEKQLNHNFNSIIEKNNPFLPKNQISKKRFVSMKDCFTGKITSINSRYYTSSTGIASGNTFEEAFCQALCEIFERYSVHKTLLNKIKCPTIPLKRLSNQTRSYINEYKEQGIKIAVKDLSLGLGLPTVGLLYYNEKEKLYEFQVGSATSLDHAVERCITEYLQMHRDIDIVGHQRDMHLNSYSRFMELFPHLKSIISNDFLEVTNYSFQQFFPSAKLTFLKENHGTFKHWDYSHNDINQELSGILKMLKVHNYHIYMKEFNKLGVPTIKIVVPELHFGEFEYALHVPGEVKKLRETLGHNFSTLNPDCLDVLLSPQFLLYALYNDPSHFFTSVRGHRNITIWEFFGLLSFALDRKDISTPFIEYASFLDDTVIERIDYLIKNPQKILPLLHSIIPKCINDCQICNESKCPHSHQQLHSTFQEKEIFPVRWLYL